MPRRAPKAPDRWTDARHREGLAGELVARAALVTAGWEIAAHRFRIGRNEIDLVARRGSLVAFIEVKTRRSTAFGHGREAVGWRKRQAIGRVAEVWRLRHGGPADTYRFDVIEVELRGSGRSRLHWMADAWRL